MKTINNVCLKLILEAVKTLSSELIEEAIVAMKYELEERERKKK